MTPSTHLLIWADIPADHEAAFNEWYNREHAPDRVLGIPGFIQARRFVAVEGAPKYVALYEVTGPEVFKNEAYLVMRRSPDPSSRKFIPNFRNVIRFIGPAIADESAVKGVAEGAWAWIAAFKSALPPSGEAQQWPELAAALVRRQGIMRVRVFQAVAEALEGAVSNMRGHDREKMRGPDRLADVLAMIEAATEGHVIGVEADMAGAIAARPYLTPLGSARVQQLMRIAIGR
jgi:hypothetical protein